MRGVGTGQRSGKRSVTSQISPAGCYRTSRGPKAYRSQADADYRPNISSKERKDPISSLSEACAEANLHRAGRQS